MENSRTQQQKSGDFGENLAAAYLAQHGFACVAFNLHSRYGEVDIIAQNEQYLLFIEVKTRRAGAKISGREAVDARKQQKLWATAEAYLAAHPTALQPRFDVLCVELAPDGSCQNIEWLENAF